MRQAQIKNGVVLNIWESAPPAPVPPDASWTFVDITHTSDVRLLDTYDAVTGTFARSTTAQYRRLTKFEFMSLLTATERTNLRTRAVTDPVLADAFNMLGVAAFVRHNHPLVTQMIQYAETSGVMTTQRRAEFEAALLALAASSPSGA